MLSVIAKILLLVNDFVRTQNRVRANSLQSSQGDGYSSDASALTPGASEDASHYRLAGVPVHGSPTAAALGRVSSSSKNEEADTRPN